MVSLSSAPGDESSCGYDVVVLPASSVVLLLLLVAWPLCALPAPGTQWLLADLVSGRLSSLSGHQLTPHRHSRFLELVSCG